MTDSASQYSSQPVERVQQRGSDGAKNSQWSSRDAGSLTNGGYIDDAPYDQPDPYRELRDPEVAKGDG